MPRPPIVSAVELAIVLRQGYDRMIEDIDAEMLEGNFDNAIDPEYASGMEAVVSMAEYLSGMINAYPGMPSVSQNAEDIEDEDPPF